MTAEKLSALLALLNPAVVQLIMDNRKLSNVDATTLFYKSALYAKLENEETKLWHLSHLVLYELFEEELRTGTINWPEET